MAIIRQGQRGENVRALQEDLNALGFDCGKADGIFGPATHTAVLAFQRSQGLAADALVGPATSAALAAARGGSRPAPSPTPPSPTPPSPTPAPGGTDWSNVPAQQRYVYVMERLVSYGYPVNAAAGIVGNLDAESGVIPSRIEGSAAATPLRAKDFAGTTQDFTPDEVMNRDFSAQRGPRLPGVGLAQWTSSGRRSGLFAHSYQGRAAGSGILFDMDAQVDYLVHELGTSYRRVDAMLRDRGVTVNDAADEVVYSVEIPGAILDGKSKRPRTDPAVTRVFEARRTRAQAALTAYRAVHPD